MEKIIKQTLYPKTIRFGKNKSIIQLTEKVDGSNLAMFKYENELYIAQRNNIFKFKDIMENKNAFKNIIYRGLFEFLSNYGKDIENRLYENSVICGEWVGMGRIKYNNRFNSRFLLFAKARINKIDNKFTLSNIVYDLDLIHWAIGEELPSYVGLVPFVCNLEYYPSLQELDDIYKNYSDNFKKQIEGFIIYQNGNITKYVRLKDGNFQPHIIK